MVNIHESVRGRDVFVIQSTSAPVNDSLMELLVIIDALRRASAGRITAVIPYFAYARQDRKARSDVGSVKRARSIATKLDAPIAIIDKRRPKANAVEIMNIIGDVKDKRCLMVDDMIDTAGTIVQGAEALKKAGAKEILACCTHGVFSGPALERLEKSCLTEIITLNTYEHKNALIPKIKQISVAPIFAEAIERVYADLPLSKLYD